MADQTSFLGDVARVYRKLAAVVALLAVTLMAGALGYRAIEGWSFFDGLYMTIITIGTVGYGETHPLSDHGRLFTMALILAGSGIMVYAVSALTAFIVEGDLTDVLKRLKMKGKIDALKGHYLICGDSNTGRYAIEELHKTHRPFVVIDKDPAKITELERREMLFVDGDATSDEVLQRAGIARASGLIATLHSDADNLFLVFTARALNPGLRIIVKAAEESSREKLLRAGADSVVMPNAIGGLRMVSELVRPAVVTFLDVMLRDKDKAIRVEEIRVREGSAAAGRILGETGILDTPGASLVALVREGAPYLFNPPSSTPLQTGDLLIMLGEAKAVHDLDLRLTPAP